MVIDCIKVRLRVGGRTSHHDNKKYAYVNKYTH